MAQRILFFYFFFIFPKRKIRELENYVFKTKTQKDLRQCNETVYGHNLSLCKKDEFKSFPVLIARNSVHNAYSYAAGCIIRRARFKRNKYSEIITWDLKKKHYNNNRKKAKSEFVYIAVRVHSVHDFFSFFFFFHFFFQPDRFLSNSRRYDGL